MQGEKGLIKCNIFITACHTPNLTTPHTFQASEEKRMNFWSNFIRAELLFKELSGPNIQRPGECWMVVTHVRFISKKKLCRFSMACVCGYEHI